MKPIFYDIVVSLFRSRLQKVNYRQKEKQVLDSILGKGYDQRIRPSGRNDTGKVLGRVAIFYRYHSCLLMLMHKYAGQYPNKMKVHKMGRW